MTVKTHNAFSALSAKAIINLPNRSSTVCSTSRNTLSATSPKPRHIVNILKSSAQGSLHVGTELTTLGG